MSATSYGAEGSPAERLDCFAEDSTALETVGREGKRSEEGRLSHNMVPGHVGCAGGGAW